MILQHGTWRQQHEQKQPIMIVEALGNGIVNTKITVILNTIWWRWRCINGAISGDISYNSQKYQFHCVTDLVSFLHLYYFNQKMSGPYLVSVPTDAIVTGELLLFSLSSCFFHTTRSKEMQPFHAIGQLSGGVSVVAQQPAKNNTDKYKQNKPRQLPL